LRSRDAADVGGGRAGGGACVDGRAERGQVEVPTRRVNHLGVDDRDTGAGGRARPVADVVRQDRAGAADVEVGRLVVEADVVADRGVVRGPDAAAGVGHRVVDDDPARRLVLRVRLDAVVLALVDDVVRDDAVYRGLGRVDAVYPRLVAGLPQPDVVDEVAVDQDVFERVLVPEVDSGAALPAGPPGEELADGVDVAADDLDIGGVDHDAVAQARVDVAGDLEVLEPDVGVVDLDSGLLGGAVVALDRGAPLVLGLDGDEVPGRAALGRDDVALVDAVSHQHGVTGAGGAHTARDRGLRRLRHQPRVRVVPGRRDVDRLRFGVGCREQLDRREGPPLPGGGGHADRLRVGVRRLLVGGPGLDVRRRARLGLGGRAAVGRRAGRDVPVHVQPGDDRKLRGGGDRHVRGAGAAQRRVAGGQGVHHGVRPALNDHAVVAGLAPPRDRHRHRAGALVPHLGHEDPRLGVVRGLNVLPHAVGQAAAGDRVDVRVVVVLVPAF